MGSGLETKLLRWCRKLSGVMTGPPALAFLPALCLGTYWFGGEGALLICAAMIPILYLLMGGFHGPSETGITRFDNASNVLHGIAFEERAEKVYLQTQTLGWKSAAFSFAIEDFATLQDRYGKAAVDEVVTRIAERLISALRDNDAVGIMGDGRFSVCLDPVRHLDLELAIQMAGRLQRAAEEPISVDASVLYVSLSVGFCLHARAPGAMGKIWLQASDMALANALRYGPSAIRAFSEKLLPPTTQSAALIDEVAQALETGQIVPWFQPQISTDTGKISGFEALARWSHPTRGLLLPSDFLPALDQAALLERLAEVMMYHSFAALNTWDAAGVSVPQVGVNFAGSELSNPNLIDKVTWELDRFNLTPDRLAIEVLETVVASEPDDMITRNIIALGKLGCRIDLDDFGTGNASIASIRRFSVNRIKIDRSFVMKSDRDRDQQRMIGAILTMAERLGVETLAEGVESVGEHVILAQLGCDHVQGYGIARPMPIDQTLAWINTHQEKLGQMPRFLDGKQ